MEDCVIVGGGPAGLTAALYLARFLRRVTVVDAQDGRARMIPSTHNLGPFPDGIAGRELLDRMTAHAVRYGASVTTGMVRTVTQDAAGFRVVTDCGPLMARALVLATGVFNHRPPLSVDDHDRGLARGLIRYCPVCDGHEVRGKRVAVLGAGRHGLDEALFISTYARRVTLIPTVGTDMVSAKGVDVASAPVRSLCLSDSQVTATCSNGDTMVFDTFYVALGSTARTGLAEELGLRLTPGGCIAVDEKQRTSLERVHAIGDVTEGLDQIAVAMGHGAVAATAIHNALR